LPVSLGMPGDLGSDHPGPSNQSVTACHSLWLEHTSNHDIRSSYHCKEFETVLIFWAEDTSSTFVPGLGISQFCHDLEVCSNTKNLEAPLRRPCGVTVADRNPLSSSEAHWWRSLGCDHGAPSGRHSRIRLRPGAAHRINSTLGDCQPKHREPSNNVKIAFIIA